MRAPAVMLPPREVEAAGRTWTVRRAWPTADGTCDLELTAPGVRGVRAGEWSAGGAFVADEVRDRRLSALAGLAESGEVVSWRRGRRAVVRADADGAFAKVVRPAAAASVVAAHRDAAEFRRGFAVPIPETDDADAGVVRLSRLPGRTLCDLGADARVSDDAVARAWRAWGEGWTAVLGTPGTTRGSGATDGPGADRARHSGADEAAVLERWLGHAASVSPLPAGLRATAARVVDGLVHGPAGERGVAHRDLHDKQVLVAGAGMPGLIDLDTAAVAEKALDLANLRAHVAWRRAQARLSAVRARSAIAVIDDVARTADVDPERMRLYEAATRMRLGAVYLFRPQWRALAEAWLDAHEHKDALTFGFGGAYAAGAR